MSFFRGRTTTTRANKISEFTVNTAEYGAVVPEIIGTVRTAGNVIYYDDFTAHEHRETHKAGKGGRSKQVSITYTYTVAVILGLCEGPISGIGKVWIGKNVHNYPADDIQLTLFDGKENQQPWAYTQGKHPEKALPYPGLAYMAGVIDLGDFGSMPSYNFEVKGRLLETGDGIDVNPADYIRYVLDKICKKDMQIIGLDNYRKYCKEADLLISSPPDEDAKAAREVVNEIAKLTNAYVFWSNDKMKIVPLADRPVGNWTPNKTVVYDLTADDFLPQTGGALVIYKRKDSSAVYNQFPVEFINRANGYEKESVSYEFTEDVKNYGVRAASVTNAHYIYTKERAVKIAEQLARNNKYGRTQYTFKLDWSFCQLEVGDLVRLTDENSGIFEQVAVVNSITEGTDGCLTVTALSRAPGDYPAAKYNVHANDRTYIEYNKTAPDTIPVIFQPPADLTSDGLELWIAVKGKADGWGGCTVYVSDDNTNYRTAGQIANSARCGKLIQNITKNATDIIISCNDQLISGTPQDAERKNTLCWIGGECFSYVTATLQADGNYKLSDCIRGQYNTTAANHSAGDDFVRLDSSVLHLDFTKEDIGKKIYLKFPSVNIFGEGEQDLSAVKMYEYTLQNYYIPPVTAVSAHSRYRQQVDKKSLYDVVVSWAKPDLQSYLQGDVWYKTKAATDTGYGTEWQFAGSGETEVTIPQCVAGTSLHITVCTKDKFGAATAPDTSPATEILVALKNATPTTPEGFSVSFGSVCTASWKEVTNADIVYYEIRTDKAPGKDTPGLLAKTNSTSCTLPLTARTGRLYLYAKSATGAYSSPAELAYSKAKPDTPATPILTPSIGGFSVQAGAVPSGCNGMTVYINDDVALKSTSNALSYVCDASVYDVQVAYTDLFGEGDKSPEARVTVQIQIGAEMLADEAVSLRAVNAEIKTTLQDAADAVREITTLQSGQTSIAQSVEALKNQVDADWKALNEKNASDTQSIIDALNKVPEESGYKSIKDLKATADEQATTIANNKKVQDGVNATNATKISQNATNITSLATRVTNTEKANISQQTAISQNAMDITSLAKRVTTTEGNISTQQTSVKQNADSISALAARTTANETSISSIKQTASSNTSTIASVQTIANTAKTTADTASKNASTAVSTATTAVTKVSSLEQTVNGFKTTVQTAQTNADLYAQMTAKIAHAKLLNDDPTFKKGIWLKPYHNTGTGAIHLTSKAVQPQDPNTGGNIVWITKDAGTHAPGWGGFYVGGCCPGGYNKLYIMRFVAKIPKGFTLYVGTNYMGEGGVAKVIGDASGTGDWKEYIAYWQYGRKLASGKSFGDCGYIYWNKSGDNTPAYTEGYYLSSVELYLADNYQLVPDSVQSQITQTANSVISIVGNLATLDKAKANYAAFTQLQDAINLKVQKGDVINQINVSPTTTTIDGKYLHVTGTTKFDNGVITNGMLAAKSITADKLSVSSLSAMCATIGTLRTKTSGARLEIKDNLLEVYDENNMLRVRLGVWN